jgi:predicted ATPase
MTPVRHEEPLPGIDCHRTLDINTPSCTPRKIEDFRVDCRSSRLWYGQNRRTEALALLQPVYDRFTEGFDTADLKAAKALLDTLL